MLFKKKIKTKIGYLTAVASEKGLQALHIEGFENSKISFLDIKEAKKNSLLLQCEKELKEYFSGKRKKFDIALDPQGTEFQKKVWTSLKKIPFGKTISYLQQANSVGNKKAVRAVAAANGKNPLAIIVPCHRVIASTGHLHGYAGGLLLKQKILELEGLRVENLKISLK